MASDDRPDEERVLLRGEATITYCFDFQDFSQVAGGGTLSGPTTAISSGPALVQLGTPEVNVVDFLELDAAGDVEKTVPAGKGVKVAVTPSAIGAAKGECFATCLVDCSDGSRPGQRVKFIVK